MTRVSKNPEERRNELLDAAEELFSTIGYNRTAISDIVKKVSVAQGTFYYYFKSKEDIYVAILDRGLKVLIQNFNEKLKTKNYSALEKLIEFIKLDFQDRISDHRERLISELHDDQNAGLHQKVIINGILNNKPLLASIIKEGIAEGVFKTDFPEEIAEMFLITARFGLDPGIFNLSQEEYMKKLPAVFDLLEKALGLPKGTFDVEKIFSS